MTFKLQELSFEDVSRTLTHDPDAFLEPLYDVLAQYGEASHQYKTEWKDVDLQVKKGRLHLGEFPFHPYTENRLVRRVLGVSGFNVDFWLENLDLFAEALRRGADFQPSDVVQVGVVAGQVVYVSLIDLDLGTHLDFFEPMAKAFKRSAARSRTPMSLSAYLYDPAWCHLRVLYLPRSADTNYTGVFFDTNYLFSRNLRGRAVYGLFAQNIVHESTLNLDAWWSVRSLQLNRAKQDLREAFEKTLNKRAVKLRRQARGAKESLFHKSNRKASAPWRTSLVADVGRKYAGVPRLRSELLKLDASGRDSITDLGFVLARAMKDLPLSRRLAAERLIANAIKEVS